MKAHIFRNLIDKVHKEWLARQLFMEPNDEHVDIFGGIAGIDLIDPTKGVELKARLGNISSKNHHTIDARQFLGFPDIYEEKLYWAFMRYMLNKPVSELEEVTEDSVASRRVIVVPWNVVEGKKIWTPKTGPYIYINKADLEGFMSRPDMVEHRTKKGPIYVARSFLKD